ncbi:MAG TPA: hypothetical protein VGS62_07630 [Streptosporangiaceae bacterium]|nr:hypothetical protein [Streptosporangiaceae bacterium]
MPLTVLIVDDHEAFPQVARADKSHKLWTDDYLAAFAQASDATLITLDRKVPARYPSVRVELVC